MTNDFRGLHQRPRNPTKALEPGKAYDLLTALHQSAGDGRYTVLRCQCGARVIRLSRQVARAIREGERQACSKCIIRLKAERKAAVLETGT